MYIEYIEDHNPILVKDTIWTDQLIDGDMEPTGTTKWITHKLSGMSCSKCNEFNKYAEPNHTNNTFICYKCRNNL